jgi:hypothetical protein
LLIRFLIVVSKLLLAAPAPAPAETSYGLMLTPGIYRGGKGRDLSILYYSMDSGAFAFSGVNIGHTEFGTPSDYAEIEVGGNGWGLATLVLGVGRFRQGPRSGTQATVSMQYFLPFLVYWRAREGVTTTDEKKRPKHLEFGLLWKIPVPVIEWKVGQWRWGMSGVFSAAKED